MALGKENIIGELKEIKNVFKDIAKLGYVSVFFENDVPFWKNLVKTVLYHCCFFVLRSHLIAFVVAGVYFEQDTKLAVENMIISVNILSVQWRGYKFFSEIDTLKRLMWDPTSLHCNLHRPYQALSQLSRSRKSIQKIVKGSAIYLVLSVLVYNTFPMFPKIKAVLFEGKTYNEAFAKFISFLYKGYLPPPWKEIQYLYELFVATVTLDIWILSTLMYYGIVSMLSTQFRILKESLVEQTDSVLGDCPAPMSMRLFVEDHSKLRQLCFELKQHLSSILGFSLALSITLIGFNSYSAVASQASGEAAAESYPSRYIMHAGLACGETFIFCWLSAQITAANDISDTIYNCDWYTSLNSPKEYVLVILSAQRNVCFTAWNMVNVSLSTSVDVLRLSYSFYTLMKRMK